MVRLFQGVWRVRPLGRIAAAAALSLFLSGCALIRADFRESGGAVGHIANQYIYAYDNKIQLYRATAVYSFFTVMGAHFAEKKDQIHALLRYMVAVRNDLNKLASHTFLEEVIDKCTQQINLKNPNVDGCYYYWNFEFHLPAYESNMYKLVVSALPNFKSQEILNKLTSQNPASFIDGLVQLATAMEEVIAAGHNFAAAYRSERELFGIMVCLRNPQTPDKSCEKKIRSVQAAISEIDSANNDNVSDNLKSINSPAFGSLMYMVQQSCETLVARLQAEPTEIGPDAMRFMVYEDTNGHNPLEEQWGKVIREGRGSVVELKSYKKRLCEDFKFKAI